MERTLKTLKNENADCMTWNIPRNTEKRGKGEMLTEGPEIWRKN